MGVRASFATDPRPRQFLYACGITLRDNGAAVATTEGTSATRCLGNPRNMRSGYAKRYPLGIPLGTDCLARPHFLTNRPYKNDSSLKFKMI